MFFYKSATMCLLKSTVRVYNCNNCNKFYVKFHEQNNAKIVSKTVQLKDICKIFTNFTQ